MTDRRQAGQEEQKSVNQRVREDAVKKTCMIFDPAFNRRGVVRERRSCRPAFRSSTPGK